MRIPRFLESVVLKRLQEAERGIVLYGPRQAGKTTLVNEVIKTLGVKTLSVNADQKTLQTNILTSRNLGKLKGLVGGYDLLFVDEAQRIPEIGLNLKIILDSIPGVKVIATGSSSLDLASKISEPLTGRVWTYHLYPISMLELSKIFHPIELEEHLEQELIYGSYPKIYSLTGDDEKRAYLQHLTDAYLYKDLLEFGGIRNSAKVRDLLKLLAFQVGSLVSLSELGNALDMGKDTVNRYIDILEKSYVIFRLGGLSRNLRKEMIKMGKIYFYDIGVRNILIDNLKSLQDRNDVGQLWENFLVVERMKRQEYRQALYSHYFWRLTTGAELDLVEEEGGELKGFEFKYGKKQAKAPASWGKTYSGAPFQSINQENWQDFVK